MSEENDVNKIQSMFDDIKLQAHLLSMDMKDEWEDIRKDWDTYMHNVKKKFDAGKEDTRKEAIEAVEEMQKRLARLKNDLSN
tara:strand:- start:3021 stop:3266 length:246 start_codon:yes stop_codon:yes gene_type:complete